MSEVVSILIPTMDNPNYLIPCIQSILQYQTASDLLKVYIINNGKNDPSLYLQRETYNSNDVVILNPGKNLGWEGGLKYGLKHVPKDTEFVMFLNDDTFIPHASRTWIIRMLQWFKIKDIGIVGPATNVSMGMQNIFNLLPDQAYSVQLLIGFCMLVRKSALKEIGGIDDTLPGGDDFDISIRMIDAGYKMVLDQTVFVYHHGFTTGEKVKGKPTEMGGWNSYEMYHRTTTALIQKHGFARYQKLMFSLYRQEAIVNSDLSTKDGEGIKIRELLKNKKGKVYELGCGAQVTVKNAIGVDIIKKDEFIATIQTKSIATIKADVSKPLPFKDADIIIARHILEHMVNPISALRNWYNCLKHKGQILIAVPDEDKVFSIPMNIEHKHAYTKELAIQLLETIGFKNIKTYNAKNGVSFIITGFKL